MIREVYKGIMKAVAKELTERLRSDYDMADRFPEMVLSYENYLAYAERIAYEEICKAFRLSINRFKTSNFDELVDFTRWIVSQMGMNEKAIRCGEEGIYGCIPTIRCLYVSIFMPNTVWRISLYPGGPVLSTISSAIFKSESIGAILPSRQLHIILPELDRMYPILERMTSNLIRDTAQEFKVKQIENITRKAKKRIEKSHNP